MAEEAQNPSSSSSIPCQSSSPNETGDFECNICFELAQDPVITLCGHLYCWPCLYRWLRIHSVSHECPVCKARIDEAKLVPLYGRGKKSPTDPRSKPVPGVEIPHRPAGQRPETAPPPRQHSSGGEDRGFSSNLVFGLVGGFIPLALASLGISAGFGGAFSPFFIHFNGFPGFGTMHGGGTFGGGRRADVNAGAGADDDDEKLKKILFVILFFVLIVFLTM